MIDKIRDNIYLGSSSDAQYRHTDLREAGVTAILNVARDLTNSTTDYHDFELYQVGLMDGGGNSPIVASCALMLLNGLLQMGHTVLVHCHEGKSRSAAVVAALLVLRKDYASLGEAEMDLRTHRPRVEINPELRTLFTSII